MKQLKGSTMRCNATTNYPRSLTPPPNVQCEHTGHYYHAGKYFCKTHAALWALELVLETDHHQLEADIFKEIQSQYKGVGHYVTNLEGDKQICLGHTIINISRLVKNLGLKGTMR